MALVMIIEDDEIIRSSFSELLKLQGYEVVDVADGDEALQFCREIAPDLVITDLLMPGKEGIETITELRRDFPNVKIIAVSGGGSRGNQGYLAAAKSLGAHRTYHKPVKPRVLIEAVAELLGEAAPGE